RPGAHAAVHPDVGELAAVVGDDVPALVDLVRVPLALPGPLDPGALGEHQAVGGLGGRTAIAQAAAGAGVARPTTAATSAAAATCIDVLRRGGLGGGGRGECAGLH